MPITQSAKKALRQSTRKHAQNVARADAYKKVIHTVRVLVSEKKVAEAKKLLSDLYKKLDKAAKGHTIGKNKASRLKSRLTKLIAKQK